MANTAYTAIKRKKKYYDLLFFSPYAEVKLILSAAVSARVQNNLGACSNGTNVISHVFDKLHVH